MRVQGARRVALEEDLRVDQVEENVASDFAEVCETREARSESVAKATLTADPDSHMPEIICCGRAR